MVCASAGERVRSREVGRGAGPRPYADGSTRALDHESSGAGKPVYDVAQCGLTARQRRQPRAFGVQRVRGGRRCRRLPLTPPRTQADPQIHPSRVAGTPAPFVAGPVACDAAVSARLTARADFAAGCDAGGVRGAGACRGSGAREEDGGKKGNQAEGAAHYGYL